MTDAETTSLPPVPAVSSFAIHGEPEQVTKLFAALAKAKRAFGPIVKGKENTFFGSKYADLADYIAATREGLADNGLCVIQPVGRTAIEFWEVRTLLIHEAGAYLETVALIPPAGDMQKNGSAQTYCKRYCFGGMLGEASAAEDDDGNGAVGNDKPAQRSQPTPPKMAPKTAQQSAPKQEGMRLPSDKELAERRAAQQAVAAVHEPDAPAPEGVPAKPAPIPPLPPAPPPTQPLAPGANSDPPTEATKLKIKGLLQELGMQKMAIDWCQKILGCVPKEIKSEAQQLVLLADLEARKGAPGDQ